MSRALPVSRITLWPLEIPMRVRFRHAAGERAVAEPLVVAIELADGTIGYGETHPRPYVSGETIESAIEAVRGIMAPHLVAFHPASLAEAFEAAEELPWADAEGRGIAAARSAVELALLDAYARAFRRSLESLAGWLGEPWAGPPGSAGTRISGVVSAEAPARAAWTVRKMRLFGLRDIKMKVAVADDDACLRRVARVLGQSLRRGGTTLRVDANGGWTPDDAVARLRSWVDLPIACVEQPLPAGDNAAMAALAAGSPFPLMADESLVTAEDAEDLVARRAVSWFNIRIGKNGGLIPSMRLAATARRHGIQYQLGCLVGETSILSAAGRWFLHLTPQVRFAEGGYGRFLLNDDVCNNPLTMRWGGRWDPPAGPGLGLTVDEAALARLCPDRPITIPL